jgi:hypothetical protein
MFPISCPLRQNGTHWSFKETYPFMQLHFCSIAFQIEFNGQIIHLPWLFLKLGGLHYSIYVHIENPFGLISSLNPWEQKHLKLNMTPLIHEGWHFPSIEIDPLIQRHLRLNKFHYEFYGHL